MRDISAVLAAHVTAGLALVACTTSSTDPPAEEVVVDAGAVEGAEAVDAALDADAAASCDLRRSYGSPDCNACLAATCCAEVTACNADATCRQLVDCAYDCLRLRADAGGCTDGCLATYSSAEPLWMSFFECAYKSQTGCGFDCSKD